MKGNRIKERKGDKFEVWVMPLKKKRHPGVKIYKFEKVGKKKIDLGVVWRMSQGVTDYESTANEIGERILENSEIAEEYKKKQKNRRRDSLKTGGRLTFYLAKDLIGCGQG